MKKSTRVMVAVSVGLAMLALGAVSARTEERPGFETYVVRSGDTLSKIAGRVFGDEKRWREILKANPQVTNANRIFPGDSLLVPAPAAAGRTGEGDGRLAAATAPVERVPAAPSTGEQGAGAAVLSPAAAPVGAATAETVAAATPAAPVEPVQPGPVVSPSLYRSAGYIADALPAIAIVASQDDRIILGTNDAAVINTSVPAGGRFTVLRAERRVYHPTTGADLGWLIRILGSAEVTCRGELTSTVVLRETTDTVGIGDYLVPFDPNDVLEKNALAAKAQPDCIPAGACDGVIVAFHELRMVAGEGELAYIDRGTASGVAPGRRFTIYRTGSGDVRIMVGELQVLRAGANTATALITNSIQEVQVGYQLRAR